MTNFVLERNIYVLFFTSSCTYKHLKALEKKVVSSWSIFVRLSLLISKWLCAIREKEYMYHITTVKNMYLVIHDTWPYILENFWWLSQRLFFRNIFLLRLSCELVVSAKAFQSGVAGLMSNSSAIGFYLEIFIVMCFQMNIP